MYTILAIIKNLCTSVLKATEMSLDTKSMSNFLKTLEIDFMSSVKHLLSSITLTFEITIFGGTPKVLTVIYHSLDGEQFQRGFHLKKLCCFDLFTYVHGIHIHI